jgi:glucan phosphoethanolaminetransferase (alkaline phosphatase superfamily)
MFGYNFSLSKTINGTLNNLNTSKYFAGLMILFLNLSSRYLALELSESQQQMLSNKVIRRFIIFTVVFVATRDVWVSIIVTAIFIVLVAGLFNENSKYCVITKPVIKEVTEDDLVEAKKVIQMYTLQKKAGIKQNTELEDSMIVDKEKHKAKVLV